MKKKEPTKPTKQAKLSKPLVEINHIWCKGCYICVEACPVGVFDRAGRLNERGFYPVVIKRPNLCTRCRDCEMLCPDMAITVE